MIARLLEKQLRPLLPLYLTGRLSPLQRRIVSAWLERSAAARAELAGLRRLRAGLETVLSQTDSPMAWPRLDAAADSRTAAAGRGFSARWVAGMALGLLLIVITWVALPPAIQLEWSVAGTSPVEFRIYRADGPGSTSFELVEQIPAGGPEASYQFRDYQLIPGREYVYRIEAIGPNDVPVADEWVTRDTWPALPGQLALLTAGLIGLYGLQVYLDRVPGPRRLRHG
jgi:hypothetical protein